MPPAVDPLLKDDSGKAEPITGWCCQIVDVKGDPNIHKSKERSGCLGSACF